MAETIKFTEEEVGKINQLRVQVSNVFTKLGQLAIEKQRRIDEIDSIEKQLIGDHAELQEVERKLFEDLNKKYGDGNYDPDTNTFTPVPSEKTEEEEVTNS